MRGLSLRSLLGGCALAAALTLLAPGFAVAADDPTFQFYGTPLRLPAGDSEGEVEIVVAAENVPKPPADPEPDPRLDAVVTAGTEIDFEEKTDRRRTGPGWRLWRFAASIEGLPADSTLTVPVVLRYGDVAHKAEITATNVPEGDVEWEVTPPPPELVLGPDRAVTFRIKTGKRPVSGLTVIDSTLQDEETKALLGVGFLTPHLVTSDGTRSSGRPAEEGGGETSTGEIDLPAEQTSGIELRVDSGFARPGSYKGNVYLAVDGVGEAKSLPLTVHSSRWRGVGVLLIALGILLSLVTVYVPTRGERLVGLQAAAALRERLPDLRSIAAEGTEILRKAAGNPRAELENVAAVLAELDRTLTRRHLDQEHFIPAWPVPWRKTRTAEFEAFLKEVGSRIAVLDVVVRKGVGKAVDLWPPAAGLESVFDTALTKFDGLMVSASKLEPAEAATKVGEILGALRDDLEGGPFRVQGAAPPPEPVPLPSSRELRLQLVTLGGVLWGLWAVVTLVTGYVVLVLPDLGFGSPLDLAKCFFWGLGVHTAGQSLQQLTPASLRTTFQVDVPKTG